MTDGVRVVHASVPSRAGGGAETSAGLLIRTGIVDETAPSRGLTRLVEHLTLAALGPRDHAYEGFTDTRVMGLVASGRAEQVGEFLRRACEQLSSLDAVDLAVFDRERSVLTAQLARGGWAEEVTAERWGYRGIGLLDVRELGLSWLDQERVAGWARTRCTAGNAALWVSGVLPPRLALPLPPGEPPPRTDVPPLPAVALPAVRQDGPGVGISLLCPDDDVLPCLHRALERGLLERLRDELDIAKAVQDDVQRAGTDLLHLALVLDVPEEHCIRAARETLALLHGWADEGPPEELVARLRDEAAAVSRDAEADADPAARALALLDDRPQQRASEEVYGGLSPRQLQQLLRQVLPSLVVSLPTVVDPTPLGLPWLEPVSRPPVLSGRRLRSAYRRRRSNGRYTSRAGRILVLADRGVTLTLAEGSVTVLFEEICVAMLTRSGAWVLADRNGRSLHVDPDAWEDAPAVQAHLQRHVPPRLVVPRVPEHVRPPLGLVR